jgi:hypothetical protein
MKNVLTKWFPFEVQPLYRGWYEVKLRAGYTRFFYWDRKWQRGCGKLMTLAAELWRGLKDPKPENYVERKVIIKKPKATPPPVVKALTLWQRIKYQIWS